MKLQNNILYDAKSATANSCFSLVGPRQCTAALGGSTTSTVAPRGLNKPGSPKALVIFVIIMYIKSAYTPEQIITIESCPDTMSDQHQCWPDMI